MADISPNVITKLNQVMFSSNEPPITSVIWAKPDGTSKRSYTFLAFSEGKWRTLSLGSGDIPQNISYFYNDVGYITMADLPEFSDVAISGSYNDLLNKPYIPAEVTETTVTNWGFTKNTGTYSKPSGGIPSTDLSNAVQTSLGKADTALQSFTETDPTVPAWAKAASKPTYTAAEVGALPNTYTPPVTSVNGQTGAVNLTIPDDSNLVHITGYETIFGDKTFAGNIYFHGTAAGEVIFDNDNYSDSKIRLKDDENEGWVQIVKGSGTNATTLQAALDERNNVQADWNQTTTTADDYIKNKPTIPAAVTESTVSGWGFTKNTGTVTGVKMNGTTKNPTSGVVDLGTVLTSFTETDPTVPSWAKASSKPSYTASEVGAVPTTRTVNGKALSSNVTLSASDVGALPSTTVIPTITFRQW